MYHYIINKLFCLSQIDFNNKLNLSPILLSDIIKIIRKKFHPTSGDCGMFALGLWKFLKDNNIYSDIYIISDFDGNPDSFEDDDFYEYQGEVYHIYLLINGKLIDGVKIYMSQEDILNCLKKYYTFDMNIFDQQPISINNENFQKIKSFIVENTNYWYNDDFYYNFLKQLVNNRKLINDV